MSKLKEFSYYNQFGEYAGWKFYIMATSRKQVVEMCEKVGSIVSENYVKNFFLLWGTADADLLKDIDRSQPCIYGIKGQQFSSKKEKVIKLV